ncbi:MAG: FGGY family carbohydrate kinase [Patescibacteria group bacterium]|nr:FGGY family carbohydrate kinase [Patescibacteria group bacterium]
MLAEYLGFDLSTTGLTGGVKGINGDEGFASVDMLGATKWLEQPAFDLDYLPEMMEGVLKQLIEKGWDFSSPGALSFSVRQHDMVVLDKYGKSVIPALSWQCNAAVKMTEWINAQEDLRQIVGKVEERFILSKLGWALAQISCPGQVNRVMTTGDYIAYRLTGIERLSASDALSNGLLKQADKCLAAEVIKACGLEPEWFPPVIESGAEVGRVRIEESAWKKICSILQGWKVISCLGDNHAGAVGCGLNSDSAIVVSAGTSGTVVRISHDEDKRLGAAACFEYYDEKLLLMMMPRCAAWYKDFVEHHSIGGTYGAIDTDIEDRIALGAELELVRVVQEKKGDDLVERYPRDWVHFPLASHAASVQASIALELLLLVKKMLVEVVDPEATINKVVLTGGLSQSSFFREVIAIGLEILQPGLRLFLSDHKGPLAYKAAALGAMINAIIGDSDGNAPDIIGELCPTSEVQRRGYIPEDIGVFLSKYLS